MDALRSFAENSSTAARILFLVVAYLAYVVALVFYRMYLHPLAGVPGPKIAAATLWWEKHSALWKHGRLAWDIKDLHDKYGPIVRINPNGVHIADPEVYEKIYRVGSTFGKDEWYYQVAFGPQTFFTVGDNAKAKIGREPISGFFSRRGVIGQLQKRVLQEVEMFQQRLNNFAATKKPMPIDRAFHCFTSDIITDAAWGMNEQWIMKEDFAAKLHDDLSTVQHGMWTRLYFPRLTRVLQLTPPKYAAMMDESLGNFLGVIELCRNQVKRIKAETKTASYSGGNEAPTIFHALLDAETKLKGKKEEDLETMTGIGALVYVAGVETSATTMVQTTYRILQNPAILKRLQEELDAAYPDPREPMDLLKLESLEYLSAVIHEGLRISYGVAGRLPRTVPAAGFQYQQYYLPPGVQIGMSALNMHTDPNIFPSPYTFSPERWLGNTAQLDKYLVNFSKGSRQCLGMNLALCEIYHTIAMLFRKYDMTVVETSERDMEIRRDFFTVFTDDESRKLQVLVKTRA